MARHYNIHVRTLPQVASLLRVEGSWPGPLSMRAGWYRARARPWNESVPDPLVRLERGGSDFLESVTSHLYSLGVDSVYSPALYPDSTRLWRTAGFDDHVALDIMERALGTSMPSNPDERVRVESSPDWDAILDIDRHAFEGFWGMSRLGLMEAHGINRSGAVLVAANAHEGGGISGYAMVGMQWATVYLHRIAVRPESSGHGLGKALLASAIDWGNRSGGRVMVLNVRRDNRRAKQLYTRLGFSPTNTALSVLRHEAR